MSDCSPSPEPEFAAFVALDWGDRKHCWRLLPAGGGPAESGDLESTPETVAQWAGGPELVDLTRLLRHDPSLELSAAYRPKQ